MTLTEPLMPADEESVITNNCEASVNPFEAMSQPKLPQISTPEAVSALQWLGGGRGLQYSLIVTHPNPRSKQGCDRSVMGVRADCPQLLVDWHAAEGFMKSPIDSSHWRSSHVSSARFLRGQEPNLPWPTSICGRTPKAPSKPSALGL